MTELTLTAKLSSKQKLHFVRFLSFLILLEFIHFCSSTDDDDGLLGSFKLTITSSLTSARHFVFLGGLLIYHQQMSFVLFCFFVFCFCFFTLSLDYLQPSLYELSSHPKYHSTFVSLSNMFCFICRVYVLFYMYFICFILYLYI